MSVAIVGKDLPFTIYNDDNVKPYLDSIESDSRSAPIDDLPAEDLGVDASGRPANPDPQVVVETMEH